MSFYPSMYYCILDGSLASLLQSDEGEPEQLYVDQSLFYLDQILQGVFHLHSLSILHLNIAGIGSGYCPLLNPRTHYLFFCHLVPAAENILVLEGGRRVKLASFGTATHIDDVCVSKLKGVTPHLSSPEVWFM